MTDKIASTNTVKTLGETLTMRSYRFGYVLLILLLGFSIIELMSVGMWQLILLPIVCLSALGIGSRSRVNHKVRTWIVAIVFFGYAAFNLLLYGWSSNARLFLLVNILLTTMIMNNKTGYAFWALGNVLLFSYLIASYAGWISPLTATQFADISFRTLLDLVVFILLGGGCVAIVDLICSQISKVQSDARVEVSALHSQRKILMERADTLQQLAEKLEKREAFLEASATVARSLTAVQPQSSLLSTMVDLISRKFDIEHTAIYLTDETDAWMVLKASSSESGKKLVAQNFRLRVDDTSVVGTAVVNRQTTTVDFERENGKVEKGSLVSALRTELAIPIQIAGDVVGVLDLQSAGRLTLDTYAIDGMEKLVSELALLLSISCRLDNIPAMDIANPFYFAGKNITSSRSDQVVYESIRTIFKEYAPNYLAFVRRHDKSGTFYTVLDMKDDETTYDPHVIDTKTFPLLQALVQYGSSLNQPVWFQNNNPDPIDLPEKLNGLLNDNKKVSSVAIVPALANENLIGVLICIFYNPHIFSRIEMRLYSLVAELTAFAVERNELLAKAQENVKEVDVLYHTTQAIVSANTMQEVLNAIVDNLVTPGIDRCILLTKGDAVDRFEGQSALIEAAWDAGEESSPITGQVWDLHEIPVISSAVVVENDIESPIELDALSTKTFQDMGLRALMIIPLRIEDDVYGWLILCALHSKFEFTERQIRIYSHFADQLTQALVNIRLVGVTEKRALMERLAREATERIREPLELRSVLEVAAEEIRSVLALDDVVIHLTMPDIGEIQTQVERE